MNEILIGEKIAQLRKKKKITQEQLAEFLGVTKASVSKWETKQSYPDILLIPQIANYLNVTIDELMGYNPQLSKEQIRKYYDALSKDFVKLPFDEVMDKTRALVKEYYSCYEFLVEICVLWMNHCVNIEDTVKRQEILEEIVGICERVEKESRDLSCIRNAISLKSVILLMMGKAQEVIEMLEPVCSNNETDDQLYTVLIQAYQTAGDISKAELTSQIHVCMSLLQLINDSINMMFFNMENEYFCRETIKRITQVIDIYNMKEINQNVVLQFYYQAAVYYASAHEMELGIKYLTDFIMGTKELLDKKEPLGRDNYLNRLNEWYEQFPLGQQMPRRREKVWESVLEIFAHPAFAEWIENEEFKQLQQSVKEEIKHEFK